jgi:polysaccharide pyruvyl transferase WcaK-like protein
MKLLIVGAFGYGNIGDDSVRDAEMQFFKEQGFEVDWNSPPYDIEKIKWCDAIVLGGGGILYDLDPANIDNYFVYCTLAKAFNKKLVLCNVGTQGLTTKLGKNKIKELLACADSISVRDPYDKEILAPLTNKEIFVAEDSAWYLPVYPKELKETIGLAVNGSETMNVKRNTFQLQFYKMLGSEGRIYCYSEEDDKFLKEISSTVLTAKNISEMSKSIDTKIMICTRFHGLITAISCGCIPVLGMGSSEHVGKHSNLAKRIGIKNVFYFNDNDAKIKFNHVMENIDKTTFENKRNEYRARAIEGMKWCVKNLDKTKE